MSGNPYLFAAYAVTWIIHIVYLGTIVSRYSRLKREMTKPEKNRWQVRTQHTCSVATICPAFSFSLSGLCCPLGLTAYLSNVKVFVWFQSQYSGDRYASASPGRRGAAELACHSCSHPTKLGNRRSFVNRNCPVSVGGSVRRSVTGNSVTGTIKKETGNGIKATFLATAVVASAIRRVLFWNQGPIPPKPSDRSPPPCQSSKASKSFSLPMFFEPNQGQTDPQVKFLARGSGYGLFLTADKPC